MQQSFVVMVAVWLEIAVGAILLMAPDVPCLLLFAAKPEGIGMPLARFAGVALIALGIACLPSSSAGSRGSAVRGLFAFNVGVVVLFTWMGAATVNRGLLLWPAAILHAVIAAALMPQLLIQDSSVV